mgnify:CR=1 FL=1
MPQEPQYNFSGIEKKYNFSGIKPRTENEPPGGSTFMSQLARHLGRQPIFGGGQFQKGDVFGGGINVANALLETAALPFTKTEELVRQIPVVGDPLANVATAPFQLASQISDVAVEGVIDPMLKSLGIGDIPASPEAKRGMTNLRRGISQFAVPLAIPRMARVPKPYDFREIPKATPEQMAQVPDLAQTAPLSEAPVSRGGSMEVRGPANQAQIDKFYKEGKYTAEQAQKFGVSPELLKQGEKPKPVEIQESFVSETPITTKAEPNFDVYGKKIETEKPNRRGIKIDPEFAQTVGSLKDLNTFEAGQFSTTDYLRATEKIDQKTNGVVRRKIVRPIEDANFNAHREIYKTQTEIQKLSKETGVKEGSKSSQRIFQSIEKRLEGDLTPSEKRFEGYLKGNYDNLLNRLNEERKRINLEPIKKRQNYITHINELNTIQDFFGSLSDPRIPPELIRAAEFSKPNSPFFRFMLERRGGKFTEDAVGAFSAYYRPAINNIYKTVPLANARAYVKHLPPNASIYFTSWLNEAVATKTARLDRGVPKVISGTIQAVAGRIAKNLILGNVRVMITQLSSSAQTMAEAGILNSLKGVMSTFTPEGFRFAEQNSKILQLREFEGIEDINPSRFKALEKMSAWHIEAADRFMVRASFNAGLKKYLSEGKSMEQAVQLADDFASKTQAAYGRMFKSPLLRSKMVGSTVGQFQVYTNNLMNYMVYDLLSKRGGESNSRIAGKVATFLGTTIAVNQIYDALGFPAPYTPSTFIPAWNSIVKMAVDDENQDLAESSGGGKFGTPAAISTVVGLGAGAYRVGGGLIAGNKKQIDKGFTQLLKNAPMVILPFGGSQIRKTVEGYFAVKRGRVESAAGKALFPIRGWDEQLKTLIFGKYGSSAAQEYLREREKDVFEKPKTISVPNAPPR